MGVLFLSRRSALAGIAAGLACGLPARAAVAADEARAFVEETIALLMGIARSGTGVAEQRAAFRRLMAERMAVVPVARSILGPVWRQLGKADQDAYLEAFQDYVAVKYGSRFDEFTQVKMEITRATDLGERGVVIESRAMLPNGEVAMVDWGVSDRGGKVLLSNIVVEGVSLVTSEREIVGGMLEKAGGDIGRLIAALRSTGP
jgi:phospholipid transport system substrate-binding protein